MVSLLQVVARAAWQGRSSRWSRERLVQHQATQLARLRRFVGQRSAFYREFHRGLEARALDELPVLDKGRLMAEFDRLVTDPAIRLRDVEANLARAEPGGLYLDRYTVLSTSGSTGQRGVFLFDRGEWMRALAAITRPLAWAEAPRPWTRPRSALIASPAAWHYSARVGRDLTSRWLPSLRLDAGLPTDTLVTRLNDWQPQVLAVYPSVLLQLVQAQRTGQLQIAPRHIGTSAERLPASTRELVREAWGIPVFDTYGATEYAPIAAECRAGRLHLLEDRAIIELVDTSGRAVAPGETADRLLLTVLDRYTQPLIRYAISDRVRERPGPCPCGRPFRVIEPVEGRLEEALRFDASDGGGEITVRPIRWHALLERLPVAGWQLLQDEAGALTLTLAGLPDANLAAAAREQIAGLLREAGATPPPIALHWAEVLRRGPSGKLLLIASRRRPGGP